MSRGSSSTLVRRIALGVLLLCAVSVRAAATDADAPPVQGPAPVQPPADPEAQTKLDPLASLRALSGYLTPADMNELSVFLWAMVFDVVRGTQEANLPPDLAFKLAVLEQRFKKEGDAFLQQSMRNLERDLRRFFEERLPVPAADARKANGN